MKIEEINQLYKEHGHLPNRDERLAAICAVQNKRDAVRVILAGTTMLAFCSSALAVAVTLVLPGSGISEDLIPRGILLTYASLAGMTFAITVMGNDKKIIDILKLTGIYSSNVRAHLIKAISIDQGIPEDKVFSAEIKPGDKEALFSLAMNKHKEKKLAGTNVKSDIDKSLYSAANYFINAKYAAIQKTAKDQAFFNTAVISIDTYMNDTSREERLMDNAFDNDKYELDMARKIAESSVGDVSEQDAKQVYLACISKQAQ